MDNQNPPNREERQPAAGQAMQAALMENWERELDSMPSEESLAEQYRFSADFQKRMKRLLAGKKPGRLLPIPKALKRVAVILLAFVSVSAVVLGTAPGVRAAVKGILMQWFDDHASFQFQTEEKSTPDQWEWTYIPDGFTLADHSEDQVMCYREYTNADGQHIILEAMLAGGSTMAVDNEHSEHKVISVNHSEAHFFDGIEGYPDMLLWERDGVAFWVMCELRDTV